MPDWSAILRDHIAAPPVHSARAEEIRTELAGHLDDEYEAARSRGCSEDEAMAFALGRVPDWSELARTLERVSVQVGVMSPDARTLLLPGMTAVAGATAVVFVTARWLPWLPAPTGTPPLATTLSLLLSYVLLGALGAWLSKRAGGSPRTRFLAGIFPLLLHLAFIVSAIVMSNLTEARVHAEHARANLQLRLLFVLVLLPGIALTIGTMPFLRSRPFFDGTTRARTS